jgi:hypothetical protein
MPDRRIGIPEQIVDLTSPGWNARLGRYFIGQTGELHFGNQYSAWGGTGDMRINVKIAFGWWEEEVREKD